MNQKDHFSEKDLAPGVSDISKLQPALVGDPQRSFDRNKQVYSEFGAQAGNIATTKQNVAATGNLSTKSTQWGQNEIKSYVSAFGNAEQSGHALNAAANYQKTLGSTDAAAAEITKSIAREIGDKEDNSNTNSDVIAGAVGTALRNGASVDMAREAGQAAKNAIDLKAGKKPAVATKSGTKISSGQNAGVESKTSSDAKHAKSVSDANTIKRARSDKLLSDYKQTHGSAFGQGVSDTNTSSQTRTNTTGVGFTDGGGITFNDAEFAGNTTSVSTSTTSTTSRDNIARKLASDDGAVAAARALKAKYGDNKLQLAKANDDLGRMVFEDPRAQDIADGLILEQAYGSGLPNGASVIQGAAGYAPPPAPQSTVAAEVKEKTDPEAQKIKDQEAMAHLRDAKMKEVKTGMPQVTKQMQAIYESERRDFGSISSENLIAQHQKVWDSYGSSLDAQQKANMQKIGGEDLFKRAMANVNTTDPIMIGAAAASALGVIGQLAELAGNALAERAANKVEKPTVAKPTTTAPAGVAKEADSLGKLAGKHVLQGAGLAAAGYELVEAVQELQKNGFTPEAALKFVTAGLDAGAPEIGLSFQAAYSATRAAMEHGYGESGMTGDQWVSENITNPIFDHFHPENKPQP